VGATGQPTTARMTVVEVAATDVEEMTGGTIDAGGTTLGDLTGVVEMTGVGMAGAEMTGGTIDAGGTTLGDLTGAEMIGVEMIGAEVTGETMAIVVVEIETEGVMMTGVIGVMIGAEEMTGMRGVQEKSMKSEGQRSVKTASLSGTNQKAPQQLWFL